MGNPLRRRPQRGHRRPTATRTVDADPACRRRSRVRTHRLRLRPHTHRNCAASLEGFNHSGNGTLFTSAVTSHTVWFHRPLRTDRWLLLRQHSPVLAHGRCFGRGDVLTEDGTLVASYAQEALLRFRDGGE
ncbi:acyl-CoA thioesterase [Mycobacterium sp.]|uniref:acyl-CoA thioesterase n=1 Tax=Mycobacterium sp. TaxID=1785 RepID=UPI003F9E6250